MTASLLKRLLPTVVDETTNFICWRKLLKQKEKHVLLREGLLGEVGVECFRGTGKYFKERGIVCSTKKWNRSDAFVSEDEQYLQHYPGQHLL